SPPLGSCSGRQGLHSHPKLYPRAEGQAKLSEVGVGQVARRREIDPLALEQLGVLFEPERLQPLSNAVHRASRSLFAIRRDRLALTDSVTRSVSARASREPR